MKISMNKLKASKDLLKNAEEYIQSAIVQLDKRGVSGVETALHYIKQAYSEMDSAEKILQPISKVTRK